ncbi:GntR family transcriptional regulator [Halovulum dunhuangense]|uniref:GntR family transcriptional regulator n=1 Tax=Halovulum dunhuangense TaxID=1505036 RepID=A0A849L3Q8_9RHOB|nr:GntR family transcriptional regulator [Halovulum dunhuangense]NNU80860.1 GntR family transcriptional regulator [Halovulum dunhuangense]
MSRSDRKSQYTKALMELRELVLHGELEPGERVSEIGMSQRIGISRTPLREAMSRLIEEGLLERHPSGGCRVRSFSLSDILDAIELRGLIEGMAVRIAAQRGADPAALQACGEVLDQVDLALGAGEHEIDFELYADLNIQFHAMLAQLCNSPTIIREVERAARMPLASPSAFLKGQTALAPVRRSLFVAQAQHRAMIEAIARREGTRAEALAREHARLAASNLSHVLRQRAALAEEIPGIALLAGG